MTAKTYDRQTAKFLAVVGENMPELLGDAMQGWIQNPKSVQEVLKKAFCPPEAAPEFKIWKTIKLGTGLKTADDFRCTLRDGDFKVSDWANDIMSQQAFAQSLIGVDPEQEYDLVLLTTAQLTGKKQGGTTTEVFAGAARLGLEKCPAWMGPKLRLQYQDQPKGEWVLIGMEPFSVSDGSLSVFGVGRDDSGLWLSGRWGDPGAFWSPGDLWVFVRPRK